MNTVNLLIELAQSVHHEVQIDELLSNQPQAIKSAFLANDANALKCQLSKTDVFANESHVVQLHS